MVREKIRHMTATINVNDLISKHKLETLELKVKNKDGAIDWTIGPLSMRLKDEDDTQLHDLIRRTMSSGVNEAKITVENGELTCSGFDENLPDFSDLSDLLTGIFTEARADVRALPLGKLLDGKMHRDFGIHIARALASGDLDPNGSHRLELTCFDCLSGILGMENALGKLLGQPVAVPLSPLTVPGAPCCLPKEASSEVNEAIQASIEREICAHLALLAENAKKALDTFDRQRKPTAESPTAQRSSHERQPVPAGAREPIDDLADMGAPAPVGRA